MMDEQACLDAVAKGDVDAYELLVTADPKLEARFKRVDKAIRDLLVEVQKHFPDAQYYTGSGGFNLMLGASHANDRRQTAQQQLVALSGKASIGDGDF